MISHLRETTVSAKHPAPISVREQNKTSLRRQPATITPCHLAAKQSAPNRMLSAHNGLGVLLISPVHAKQTWPPLLLAAVTSFLMVWTDGHERTREMGHQNGSQVVSQAVALKRTCRHIHSRSVCQHSAACVHSLSHSCQCWSCL